AYTRHSWAEFFRDWLYGAGLSDWSIAKVHVQPPPSVSRRPWCQRYWNKGGKERLAEESGQTRVTVYLKQKAECNEETVLGLAMPGSEGYPIRIPILPRAGSYHLADPPTQV